MLRVRKGAALATGGVVMAGVLSACGNPVSANRDFPVVNISVTSTVKVGTKTAVKQVLNEGIVLDAQGKQVPGTFFSETCSQTATTGPEQWRCLTYLAPGGSKLYVAGGLTNDPFGTQRMLDKANSTGKMTIAKVRETAIPANARNVPKGAKAYILKVSLRQS